jgi:NAD(P)-dependent dehydrogenase (short-subunit alcohol dehydrogenase family)
VDLGLTDKVAIVTGSSKGLGLASARALVEEGCRVTICARGEAVLGEAAAMLKALAGPDGPARVLAVPADLATAAGVETVVARTVEAFGGLDILVNNIGVAKGAGIVDTSDAEWQASFDQTLFPAVRASRLAVPLMRRRGGGAIVMIASIWGRESGGPTTPSKLPKSAWRRRWPSSWRGTTFASTASRQGRFDFREDRGTAAFRRIQTAWPTSFCGSCPSGGLAAPKRSGRSSRSWCRRGRAGLAGQV